jgi:hypothetical protein
MRTDEARDLFSEAFEGDLDPERQKAFQEALAADEELRADYDDFVETFQLVGRMGELDELETPDLLHGVQERLRKRSKGRYYRDRFAKRAGPGWLMPLASSVAVLLILAVVWYVMQSTVILEAATEEPPRGEDVEHAE